MIEYLLMGILLGGAVFYILKRIKKQLIPGDGEKNCDKC
jgi:hypothetical protein